MQSSDFVSAHCFLHMFLFHSLQQGETPKNLAHKPQPQRCRRFIRSTSEFVWDTNRIRSILFDNGLTPKKRNFSNPLHTWHIVSPLSYFHVGIWMPPGLRLIPWSTRSMKVSDCEGILGFLRSLWKGTSWKNQLCEYENGISTRCKNEGAAHNSAHLFVQKAFWSGDLNAMKLQIDHCCWPLVCA